jgi:hypothetical protein
MTFSVTVLLANLNTTSNDATQTSLTAVQRKLEPSESAVLAADSDPVTYNSHTGILMSPGHVLTNSYLHNFTVSNN